MLINIEKISFRYSKALPIVLDNVNLGIKEGSVNILLGLNGCGKTTLIKIMAGLLDADSGEVLYRGKDLSSLSIKERSRTFSYVAQGSIKLDEFTVKDYLTYGFVNSLKFYESPKKDQLEKTAKMAEKLKIAHLLDKKMGEISGGERQIVSIAVCLLQDAPIILLDEPTSALDLKNQNIVLSLLKEVAREGKTILFSSHNPNHALFLNTNVILMNNGSIEKFGKAREVINIKTLKKIYGDNICLSADLPYEEISFK